MRALLAWLFLVAASCATAADRPEFDVASLKPVVLDGSDTYTANLGTYKNGVVALSNTTLAETIRFAYELTSDDLLSGPEWIKSKAIRFEIQGKTSPSTPRAQALLMLRSLLEDRFELQLRKEPRTLSYFALTAPNGAAKMQPAQDPPPETKVQGNGHIEHHSATMLLLATLIARFTRTPVVDQTGLPGMFDIKLTWARDNSLPAANAPPAEQPDGPSITEAVQKQLGLKLEKRKGPIDILVVDHALQTPKPN